MHGYCKIYCEYFAQGKQKRVTSKHRLTKTTWHDVDMRTIYHLCLLLVEAFSPLCDISSGVKYLSVSR